MERSRNTGALDFYVRRHNQHLHILYTGRKEGYTAQMVGAQATAPTASLALFCNKRENCLVLQKELSDTSVVK